MKSPHRLTADKRVGSCRASPKLPSATSFIRRTLGEIWLGKNQIIEVEEL